MSEPMDAADVRKLERRIRRDVVLVAAGIVIGIAVAQMTNEPVRGDSLAGGLGTPVLGLLLHAGAR